MLHSKQSLLNSPPQFPKYVDLSASSRQITGGHDDGAVLEIFDVFMEFVCYPPYLTYCLFCTSTW